MRDMEALQRALKAARQELHNLQVMAMRPGQSPGNAAQAGGERAGGGEAAAQGDRICAQPGRRLPLCSLSKFKAHPAGKVPGVVTYFLKD